MKIQRNELLNYVEILGKLYSEKDFSEWSKYLYFKDNKIITYDGRRFIQIDFVFDKDFIVPYKEFYKILQEIKEDEIDISVKEDKILISSKNIKVELVKKEREDLENLNFIFNNDFKKLPEDFLQAIKLTRFCVNQNSIDSSGYLTIQDNQIYCTDKFRICNYLFMDNIDDILIPLDCLDLLLKMSVEEYQIHSNYYIFRKENVIVGVLCSDIKRLDYRKYNSIFEISEALEIILPEKIKQNLELSNIFTSDDLYQKEIEFIIRNKKLICKSQNEIGAVLCEMDIDCNLELSFFIHPLFLLDILDICNKIELKEDIAVFRNEMFCYFFRIKK